MESSVASGSGSPLGAALSVQGRPTGSPEQPADTDAEPLLPVKREIMPVDDGSADQGGGSLMDSIWEVPRTAVTFSPILVLTFLVFSMVFMLMPLSTQILIEQVCYHMRDGEDCDSSEVSSHASLVAVGVVLVQGLPSFLLAGAYGSLSDIYGRKRVLVIPVLGAMCYAGGLLFIQVFKPTYYIAIAILSSFLYGCGGGILAFVMGIYAHVSDSTRNATSVRRVAFSVLHACMIGPKIFAPIMTGILASRFGFALPMVILLSIAVIALAWTLFIPESLPRGAPSRKKTFKLSLLLTLQNIKLLMTYRPAADKRSPVPYITTAFMLYGFCIFGNILVSILYMKHKFNWSPATIGYYEGLEGSIDTISMLFVPAVVGSVVHFQMTEWLQIGFGIKVIFLGLFSVANSTTMMFAILPLLLFSGPIIPYTRTILSNSVPHELQARAFSGLSGVECIASLVGPLFSVCYAFSVQRGYPGMAYQVMAALAGVSLAIVSYIMCSAELRDNLPPDERFGGLTMDVLEDAASCCSSVDYGPHAGPFSSIDESQEYDFLGPGANPRGAEHEDFAWHHSDRKGRGAVLDFGSSYGTTRNSAAPYSIDDSTGAVTL